MGETLKKRLKQTKFPGGAVQEGMLNLLVASAHIAGMLDAACGEFGISQQQYNILRILRGVHPEGYPCGEIAVRMLDRAPDVTRRIDGLVKQGMVERERLEDDRRVVITKITDEGLKLLEKMDPRMKQVDNYISKRLSAGDCRDLSRLCEALYEE